MRRDPYPSARAAPMNYRTYLRILRDRERAKDEFSRRMLEEMAVEARADVTASPRQARTLRSTVQWGVLALFALSAVAVLVAVGADALSLMTLRSSTERYVWGVFALMLATARTVMRVATSQGAPGRGDRARATHLPTLPKDEGRSRADRR